MKKILGIELGSTRIKSVLTDENANVLAQGAFEWENQLTDGLWTYPLELAVEGMRESYARLKENYKEPIRTLDAIGISGMMHGYIPLDRNGLQLAPFRTWRNTNTKEAADELSTLFGFNIPMRWSVSQYYQSVLDKLSHIEKIDYLTTLSGYIHYLLTGERVLGIDDASGMFPVKDGDFDACMMEKFNILLKEKGIDISFKDILPRVALAGESAGRLTDIGASLLDKSGELEAGILLCPPEGDMGTGMICTNCTSPGKSNISAGTSANLTVILDKPLENYYKEIDVIATPDGHPSALIHTNNCTTELDEWIGLIGEALELFGAKVNKGELYKRLFEHSLLAGRGSGIISYNFLAGEPLASTQNGAPMVVRDPKGYMDLSSFMQSQIYSAIATIGLGMDILGREGVKIDSVLGHGGYYKTEFVGQRATSAMLEAPVTVMQNAAEGGAWGMAILALYATENNIPLGEFLDKIFANTKKSVVMASEEEIEKCREFMSGYRRLLCAQKTASESM